ncbi:hypothetical protein D5086_005086, partial [Populus alba]
FLSRCFLHTLSPQPEPRRAAESKLAELANHPNYALAVLRLVAEQSIDEQIRHAAAVNFKNHLRTRWVPSLDSSFTPIIDSEKDQIKILIVNLMLSSTPRIQSQLSESLSLIGQHDFPKSWPTLLPELVSNLRAASQSDNYASINGILGTANSIFKKFRYQYKTNDLLIDLKYCLDNFSSPLLEMFLRTAALIDSMVGSGGGSPVTLKPLFESQRLCCRVFYSLNFQELPEFFEDHMKEWMTEFKKYLVNNYPVLESSAEGLGLVDELRAAVCENISLYMEKNEEEFKDYLNDFAQAVWTLLGKVSQSSSRDSLAVMAIKFLTTVSTSVHHTLFAGDGVIPQICQSIVIPNVRLRDEDEELFEMNYIEFIRRDMEGSDIDTRRRIACELLKGIATNYKQQVISIVSVQIQNLLTSYAANPAANWKDKDCAIYLVVSLSTKKIGGNSVSTDLVDVQSFFGSVIVPELQSQDVNAFLMLKAGALKFFTMFPESEENQYIMKSIMRVLGVAEITPEIAGPCIAGLTSILAEVCKNPKNPIFNHYLFESVAVLVRRACERDMSLIPSFETSLFPILQEILGNDVTEFLPYAFQLLAQLVELNRPPISDIYMEIFKLLLSPDSWTRNSNVPALVRLLQAFLEKAPEKLNQEERLAQVLGIFNRLVSVPSTDEQGFFVLNTVIENLDYGAIAPYVSHIWNALFTRLQSKRTVKYIKSLLIFMSLFLVKHGFANLVDSMNSVQAGIFLVILEQFWIPNLKLITGPIEVKLVSVASTRLICEFLTLLDAGAVRNWGKMLDSIVTLLSRPEEDRVGDEPEMPDIAENTGYTVAFVNLYNAGKKEEDPLKDIKDPREFLATSLAKLSALSPGRFPQIISENLDPANQAALHQICSTYNCPVV